MYVESTLVTGPDNERRWVPRAPRALRLTPEHLKPLLKDASITQVVVSSGVTYTTAELALIVDAIDCGFYADLEPPRAPGVHQYGVYSQPNPNFGRQLVVLDRLEDAEATLDFMITTQWNQALRRVGLDTK